ncbi:MAG: alpha/beta hydrolase, partial [Bacteroidota bacterium]
MIVKKEMYDKELQAQYGQFRFIVSLNSRKWGIRLFTILVRLSKGQKLKSAVNETHFVPSTSTKNHKIRTRIYRPENTTKTLPAMLYLHGGGYMTGIPEMATPFYSDILERRDITIVAPDYRLSQKDPFPAGFNDCYDTLLWMRDNAKELNIDPNKFIIAGHSAGGGMTAAVTLKVRDTKDV